MAKSIYDYTAKDLAGRNVKLANYKGKVLLIVNIASQCGFTPQLKGLQELYEKFKDKGFEILAFPSNQFMSQEPLEGEAISEFCSVNYGVDFKIMHKGNVRGKDAMPLYQFLSDKSQNGKTNRAPWWNFSKYLIDKNGNLADHFAEFTPPTTDKITSKIEKLLAA
jgi:glutathione peroxidase